MENSNTDNASIHTISKTVKRKLVSKDGIFISVIVILIVALIGVINPFYGSRARTKEDFKPFISALLEVDSAVEVGTNVTTYSEKVTQLKTALKQVEMLNHDQVLLKLAQGITQKHNDVATWWNRKPDLLSRPLDDPKDYELKNYPYMGYIIYNIIFDSYSKGETPSARQVLQVIWQQAYSQQQEFLRKINSGE